MTKEERKEYMRKYYAEHKEEMDDYSKKYNNEHKKERKEYMRKYYAEHKKKIIEQNKNYYKEHKMDMIQKNNEKNNETLKTANNHYQHWTYEEIKTLESLIDKNISRKEIANKLGRSYFSIKNTITKLRKEKRINNENN